MVPARANDITLIKEKGFKLNAQANQEYSQHRGKYMYFLYATGIYWVLELAEFKGYTKTVYKRTFRSLKDALTKFDELAELCKQEEK